jgi:V8-like Glu-specific endopeptidase
MFSLLAKPARKSNQLARNQEGRNQRRLAVETLERREVLTAITAVNNTSNFPNRAAVSIECTWDNNHNGRIDNGDTTFIGSGAMIGRNTVLTAGHVLYDNNSSTKESGFATWVTVRPGRTPTSSPYGAISAVSMTVSTAWTQGNSAGDIGTIRLASNVGDRTGYFGYWAAPDSVLQNNTLSMLHYPGANGYSGTQQYFSSGRESSINSTTINYNHNVISTFGGSSGAPVYLSNFSYNGHTYSNIIVGVHVRGAVGQNNAPNSATRITSGWQSLIATSLQKDGNTARSLSSLQSAGGQSDLVSSNASSDPGTLLAKNNQAVARTTSVNSGHTASEQAVALHDQALDTLTTETLGKKTVVTDLNVELFAHQNASDAAFADLAADFLQQPVLTA